MNIHFVCSSCQTAHQAEVRLAGRTLKCFQCGHLFVVPAAPVAPAAPPVPAPVAPVARPWVPQPTPPAPPVSLPPEAPPMPVDPGFAEEPPAPVPPPPLPEVDPAFDDDLFGNSYRSAAAPLADPVDEAPLDIADLFEDGMPSPHAEVAHDPVAAAYDFAEPLGGYPLAIPEETDIPGAEPLEELDILEAEPLEELDILEAEPLEEPEPPTPNQGRPW